MLSAPPLDRCISRSFDVFDHAEARRRLAEARCLLLLVLLMFEVDFRFSLFLFLSSFSSLRLKSPSIVCRLLRTISTLSNESSIVRSVWTLVILLLPLVYPLARVRVHGTEGREKESYLVGDRDQTVHYRLRRLDAKTVIVPRSAGCNSVASACVDLASMSQVGVATSGQTVVRASGPGHAVSCE